MNWKKYDNGNYHVAFNGDTGTKIRYMEDDGAEFIPSFSECCDVLITQKCDGGCPYCYEGCTPEGHHAKLDWEFLNHLHPYTELAVNGNDLSHPDLIPFLQKLKNQHVFANITVNQLHFEREQETIQKLVDECLVHGVGVSLRNATPEFVKMLKAYPNAVLHVINGIVTEKDMEVLKDNDLKLLILGYKHLRRGEDYYGNNEEEVVSNQNWLYDALGSLLNKFKAVSFDNLSLEQLDVRRFMNDEEWAEFYMGDDAQYTFYIDLVNGVFGRNSLATERYPIMDNIDDMFHMIREKEPEKKSA